MRKIFNRLAGGRLTQATTLMKQWKYLPSRPPKTKAGQFVEGLSRIVQRRVGAVQESLRRVSAIATAKQHRTAAILAGRHSLMLKSAIDKWNYTRDEANIKR